MGDRKVTNKYIPADFDPALIPKGKKLSSKDGTVDVRMMLPFSVQCSTCHTFLYRGRKFNSKKEAVKGPKGKYLGIQRFRFYIKCTQCSRPLTFLTDPENADYEMESGGTRNYEVYKDKEKTEEDAAAEKEQTEKEDPMKALENRVLDSQREMADLDNLEEIKAMNARHIQMDTESILKKQHDPEEKETELTEEDEALVKSIQFGQKDKIRRLDEDDEKRLEEMRKREAALLEEQQKKLAKKTAPKTRPAIPVIKVKRKRAADNDVNKKPKTSTETAKEDNGGLAGLLGGYGSDSDSD